MSTIIMNVNDTVVSGDTIVMKFVKVAGECQPVVNETGTNCNDMWIVVAVCSTIALLALFSLCAFLASRNKELRAVRDERNAKNAKEEKDNRSRLKANLLDKYLDYLKGQEKTTQYKQVLEYLVELSQKDKLNEVSIEKLKTFSDNTSSKGKNKGEA